MKKIKDFIISLLMALLIGTAVVVFIEISLFPIRFFLNNKWWSFVSSETMNNVSYWTAQLVGSGAFIILMYKNLRDRQWSTVSSIIAVGLGFLLLIIGGLSLVILYVKILS